MTNAMIAKYANRFYVDMQIEEMLPQEPYQIFVKLCIAYSTESA